MTYKRLLNNAEFEMIWTVTLGDCSGRELLAVHCKQWESVPKEILEFVHLILAVHL